MSLPAGPLVAWLGDDFTGSAAVMEALEFAGLPAVLFLKPPTDAQLARFPNARGIGIATTARTHAPDRMERELPGHFDALKATGAPVIHYKVCSTLDSAPHIGSIGKALDIGAQIVPSAWIPFLVAAPNMRRYQCFGHLFAGAPEGVFRLDRHPVMSRHPVTPMTESDVALHLSEQTKQPAGCLDLEGLGSDPAAALADMIGNGVRIVTLDAMTMEDMAKAGALIWNTDKPILCAGSQGVEYALVEHWRAAGLIPCTDITDSAGPAERIIAVSGSVSPVTAAQIDWAEENGFAAILLDAAAVACGDKAAEHAATEAARRALDEGRDPVIYSARGPDDPNVARMRDAIRAAGLDTDTANAAIGAALGRILRTLLRDTGIRRAVISGGDTSGHAIAALDIYALTALAPTIPGAALLRSWSEDPSLDGLQIALKGGQMGSRDFLGWIKRGGGAAIGRIA